MNILAFFSRHLPSRMARIGRHCMRLALIPMVVGCGGGGGTSAIDSPSSTGSGHTEEVAPPPTVESPAPAPGAEPATPPAPGSENALLTPFIIPFDSTDKSIVFRSSLTSPAAIQSAGGVEEATSDNEFDAALGMKPRSTVGGVPGARFSLDAISGIADLPAGQLSIEVEREWLAVTNSEIGSVGYSHAGDEYLLSYGAGGTQSVGKLYLQPDQKLAWLFKGSEGYRLSSYVNTTRSSRYARITISWTTSQAELYLDGLRITSLPRTDPGADCLSTIYIGNRAGTNNAPFGGRYYVRNLIVSSEPVTSLAQPLLAHIMHIGDSFAAGQPYFNTATKYDGTIVNTVIKELNSRGLGFKRYSVFSNGGGQIQDNGHDPLELDVGQSLTRAGALARDPSLVVFITGGNDRSIFNSVQFTQDLHDHIEAFLGANGHPQTPTEHVIVTTTTSNLHADASITLQMRQIMLELPAWWDAAYPTRAGAVSVIDTWTLFGGAQADSTLFGIADPIHPSAGGNIVYGTAIAEEISRLVHEELSAASTP